MADRVVPAAEPHKQLWAITLVTTALFADCGSELGDWLLEAVEDEDDVAAAEALTNDPNTRLALYDFAVRFCQSWESDVVLMRTDAILRADRNVARFVHRVPRKLAPSVNFANLIRLEAAWLTPNAERKSTCIEPRLRPVGVCRSDAEKPVWSRRVRPPGTTREPFVEIPVRDYFGLALSGGGIRSATFNLGLLQALSEKGVLEKVDYVSTVSGGGYIGGFWTAYRHHEHQRSFPGRPATGDSARTQEHPAIRHLREFSRFLVPRVGIAQTETWAAVGAVLSGLLASSLAMVGFLALLFYIWYFATYQLATLEYWKGAAAFAALTLGFHVASEVRLRRIGKLGATGASFGWPVACAVLTFAVWFILCKESRKYLPEFSHDAIAALGIGDAFGSRPLCVMCPAVVWLATAVLVMFVRGFTARFIGNKRNRLASAAALDRTMNRCLASALIFAAIALVWLLTYLLGEYKIETPAGDVPGAAVTAAGAVAATGTFALLKDWLNAPVTETRGSALLKRLANILRPVLPQVVAALAVILIVLAVAILVQKYGLSHPTIPNLAVIGMGVAMLLVLGALVFFDPARIGLHDFYRARIARCFLGGARARADSTTVRSGAATTEQFDDDMTLGQLRAHSTDMDRGPIHLICCAANNLNGDVLTSLYRGARSATLSPFGVSVGNFAAPVDELRFSAALTASAAAVNSQMGSISTSLGPSVAFLMCTLNLRLGLWVPHPLDPSPRRSLIPGWFFFLEALGMSRSDQARSYDITQGGFAGFFGRYSTKLHLSDGGHFENLALYELVRRHCRYVIVSDATADPDLAFQDLGNAIRRVREDFGVEIDLDVRPLHKNDQGYAAQHAVVGTIHYDGLDGMDKGMLIYFKPTLTGDEPTDVIEHRIANPSFPQDGTGDQFYDEAQWESYRRLGQHSAAAVLRLPTTTLETNFVDKLFDLANQLWHPAQQQNEEVFLGLTQRCAALEADIRDNAPASLHAEFFPEVGAALKSATSGGRSISSEALAAETTKIVYYLMLVVQLMEDVWLGANLDVYWSHPLNEGWMNYFRRWTATPSLRRWWPVLRPIYSLGFQDFVEQRFRLRFNKDGQNQRFEGAQLKLLPEPSSELTSSALSGLAAEMWTRQKSDALASNRKALVYQMTLQGEANVTIHPIDVGILLYETGDGEVSWKASDLYVPPLLGAGITACFLEAVVARFSDRRIRVDVDDPSANANGSSPSSMAAPPKLRDFATRRALGQTIASYKSHGFVYDHDQAPSCQVARLVRAPALPSSASIAPRSATGDVSAAE